MDRQIVYPGAIPLDTDILNVQRNTMVALGAMLQACLGTGTVVDGLACTPTSPASLAVTVGPGSITQSTILDSLAFGSLAANAATPLVKMGINVNPTSLTLVAPTVSGQAVNCLIQASFAETDTSPIVLPYYNAANPALPYSGPNGTGATQNTQRVQRVQLQVKQGVPAVSGTQTTPAVDNGWIGLYVITLAYGQTQITASNITSLPTAPFIGFKLPQLVPGFSRNTVYVNNDVWNVPQGVSRIRVRLVGGGGGGAGGTASYSGGGGGAGGYSEGIFAVVPGQQLIVTVGGGGVGGGPTSAGGAGGTTSLGTLCSASGGNGGNTNSSPNYAGGAPGQGFGGQLNFSGGFGTDGAPSNTTGGLGGASAFGGGGRAAVGGGSPTNGQAPGSGGGGAYSIAGNGGAGAKGIVIIEY